MTLSVLVIEDRDEKNADITKALRDELGDPIIQRVTTLNDAEDHLDGSFDLIVLDISMNINSAVSTYARGAVADLGGLELVEYMYLNSIETRVVVVTGFDFFRLYGPGATSEMIGLDDLEGRVRGRIGDQLLGVVRYGSAGWRTELRGIVKAAVSN